MTQIECLWLEIKFRFWLRVIHPINYMTGFYDNWYGGENE
jgi:hypothetical protein